MSYIEKNLLTDENLIYRGKLHLIVFLWPVIWFAVAMIFFIRGGDDADIGYLFIFIALVTGINSFITFQTSEFGLTNKRIIMKTGFVRRNSLEILLTKVEGIQVSQGILGRILGIGSIAISGTGGTRNPYHKIHAPLEFRRKMQEQIAVVQE